MDIQLQKSILIEQFKQVTDINLINAIESILKYALKKENDDFDIPEEHKEIVRKRIGKSNENPERLIDWDEVKDNFILDQMKYKIKIEPEANQDIQETINWYNERQKGLGRKFHNEIKNYFKHLKFNPFYEIRYDNVRCITIKKFPYTIHFTVNEVDNTVIVRAIFHTSRNPEIWKNRI